MRKIDWKRIDWGKIEGGVKLYNTINGNINPLDKENFQKKFSYFYKVRRNQTWKKEFFQTFYKFHKSSKEPQFEDILNDLRDKTKRMEASFASKMLHTLNPKMPIWDSIVVIHQLGIKVPVKKNNATDKDEKKRMNKIIAIYEQLRNGYDSFINTDQGKIIITEFDKHNPETKIENIKKGDYFILCF